MGSLPSLHHNNAICNYSYIFVLTTKIKKDMSFSRTNPTHFIIVIDLSWRNDAVYKDTNDIVWTKQGINFVEYIILELLR